MTQAGTSLKIQQHGAGTAAETVLNLAGAEVKGLGPGGRGIDSVTTAHWDGNNLVVTCRLASIAKIDQVISIKAGVLTIETKHYVGGTTYPAEGPKPLVFTYRKQ